MNKKICFVVQRYGLEVNGGAELQCRLFAEHLVQRGNKLSVFTTKAIDYISWKNEYSKDKENINGVTVYRFPVDRERSDAFNRLNGLFLNGLLPQSKEKDWFLAQGPYAPKLIQAIEKNKDRFDVFVFFTYLYYPTVFGLEKVREKAIFIPEAHQEPFLKFRCIQSLFRKPAAFFFNTEEEKELVHKEFHNQRIPYGIGGIGIEIPKDIQADRFKEKYGLEQFILYVGRIDGGKNCPELFQLFELYKKRNQNELKLVLMGKNVISIPKNKDIISLGFVDEQDKYDGIAGALTLVLPSKFESLSMVVLEAMAVKTNVMVNGACEVLKGHCKKSNGAFYYENYYEFEGQLNYLQKHPEVAAVMKENAKKYVDENYQWDVLMDKLSGLMEQVMQCS